MTVKKKTAPEAPKDKRVLHVSQSEGEDSDEAISKTLLRPDVTAAYCMQTWEPLHTVDGIRAALTQQIDEVHSGNMKRPEAMLLSQAHTLDALFNNLAQKAHAQAQMPQYEGFMRMALRAQNQCRTTLETLSNIKNPPVLFAKQANINNGNQQINNGVPAPRTEENKNQPNELLTELQNATLDSRRTGETIGIDTRLETVGEVHRSEDT